MARKNSSPSAEGWPVEWTCAGVIVVAVAAISQVGRFAPSLFLRQCTTLSGMCTPAQCSCPEDLKKRELTTQDAQACYQCITGFCPAVPEGDPTCSTSACECEDPTWLRTDIQVDGQSCWQCVQLSLDFTARSSGNSTCLGYATASASDSNSARRLVSVTKKSECLALRYNGARITEKRQNSSCLAWQSFGQFWALEECHSKDERMQFQSLLAPDGGPSSKVYCSGQNSSEFCIEVAENVCMEEEGRCSIESCRCEDPTWTRQELQTLDGSPCFTCVPPPAYCTTALDSCTAGTCECQDPFLNKVAVDATDGEQTSQTPCFRCQSQPVQQAEASVVGKLVLLVMVGIVVGCCVRRIRDPSPARSRARRGSADGPRSWSERWAEELEGLLEALYEIFIDGPIAVFRWMRPFFRHAGRILDQILDACDEALDPCYCAIDYVQATIWDWVTIQHDRLVAFTYWSCDKTADFWQLLCVGWHKLRGTEKGAPVKTKTGKRSRARKETGAAEPAAPAAPAVSTKKDNKARDEPDASNVNPADAEKDNLSWDPLGLTGPAAAASAVSTPVTVPDELVRQLANSRSFQAAQSQNSSSSTVPRGTPVQSRVQRKLQQRREALAQREAAAAASSSAVEATPIDDSWIDELEQKEQRGKAASKKDAKTAKGARKKNSSLKDASPVGMGDEPNATEELLVSQQTREGSAVVDAVEQRQTVTPEEEEGEEEEEDEEEEEEEESKTELNKGAACVQSARLVEPAIPDNTAIASTSETPCGAHGQKSCDEQRATDKSSSALAESAEHAEDVKESMTESEEPKDSVKQDEVADGTTSVFDPELLLSEVVHGLFLLSGSSDLPTPLAKTEHITSPVTEQQQAPKSRESYASTRKAAASSKGKQATQSAPKALEHPAHQDHDAGVPENKAKLISEKVEVKKQKVSKVSSKTKGKTCFPAEADVSQSPQPLILPTQPSAAVQSAGVTQPDGVGEEFVDPNKKESGFETRRGRRSLGKRGSVQTADDQLGATYTYSAEKVADAAQQESASPFASTVPSTADARAKAPETVQAPQSQQAQQAQPAQQVPHAQQAQQVQQAQQPAQGTPKLQGGTGSQVTPKSAAQASQTGNIAQVAKSPQAPKAAQALQASPQTSPTPQATRTPPPPSQQPGKSTQQTQQEQETHQASETNAPNGQAKAGPQKASNGAPRAWAQVVAGWAASGKTAAAEGGQDANDDSASKDPPKFVSNLGAEAPEFVPFAMMQQQFKDVMRSKRQKKGKRTGVKQHGVGEISASFRNVPGDEGAHDGGDLVTSITISGLLPEETPDGFKDQLDMAWGLAGTYNLFFMPVDPQMQTNAGSVFINFIDQAFVFLFCWLHQEYQAQGMVTPAETQGFDACHAEWTQYAAATESVSQPLVVPHPIPSQWAVNTVNMILSPQFREQFSKTKLCVFHKKNRCELGVACPFAHSQNELQPVPDLAKTKLCYNYFRGLCADSRCKFAHGSQELRSMWMPYSPGMWILSQDAKGGVEVYPSLQDMQGMSPEAMGYMGLDQPFMAGMDIPLMMHETSSSGLVDDEMSESAATLSAGCFSRCQTEQILGHLSPPVQGSDPCSRMESSAPTLDRSCTSDDRRVALRVRGTFMEAMQIKDEEILESRRRSWSDGDLPAIREAMEEAEVV